MENLVSFVLAGSILLFFICAPVIIGFFTASWITKDVTHRTKYRKIAWWLFGIPLILFFLCLVAWGILSLVK